MSKYFNRTLFKLIILYFSLQTKETQTRLFQTMENPTNNNQQPAEEEKTQDAASAAQEETKGGEQQENNNTNNEGRSFVFNE